MRLDHEAGALPGHPASTGLAAMDADGDGRLELLVGDEESWYVLAYDPERNEYRQLLHRQYDRNGGRLEHVARADVEGDGSLEVVALHFAGSIQVHDAVDGRLLQSFDPDAGDWDAALVADIEPEPGDEVVVSGTFGTQPGLHVHRFGDAVPLWSIPEVVADDMTVGQVDLDPSLELLVTNPVPGESGWVIDIDSRSVESVLPPPVAGYLATADFDGDGVDEIVSGYYWGRLAVFDGLTHEERWAFDTSRVRSLAIEDMDGDGVPEVLYSDISAIFSVDGLTGARQRWIAAPNGLTAHVERADVDGDCVRELVWGTWERSRFTLSVGDFDAGVIEFESRPVGGDAHRIGIGDVDVDGRTELLVVNRGRDVARSLELNRNEGEEHLVGPLKQGVGLVLADLDADPQLEFVIDATQTRGGGVKAWDALTFTPDWEAALWPGEETSCVHGADLDADGIPEILVGSRYESSAADGSYLRVLDGRSGELLWRIPNVHGGETVRSAGAAALDDDAAPEIAYATVDGFHVFDWESRTEEWSESVPDPLCLRTADWDGDGLEELLIGTESGSLEVFDMRSRSVESHADLVPGWLNGVRLADLDGDGARELLLAAGRLGSGSVRILSLDTLELLWESPPLAGQPGLGDSLQVSDVDDDGRLEVVVSNGPSVSVFEYESPRLDDTPPFWPESPGLRSAGPAWTATCCPSADLAWDSAQDALSPPLRYRIYRDPDPFFSPGPANLIAETTLLAHRDPGLLPETDYSYLVRAVDRQGNEDDNLERIQVRTPPTHPPEAATLVSATDLELCVDSGVELVFSHPGSAAPLRFDLLADGAVVAEDVASPFVWNPPDASRRDYAIRAQYRDCGLESSSNRIRQIDQRAIALEPARAVRVVDPDRCREGRLRIRFLHPGFGWDEGHHELWRDGSLFLPQVEDGSEFDPLDLLPHDYEVRSFDASCAQEERSEPIRQPDLTGCTDPLLRLARTGPGELLLSWMPYAGATSHDAYLGTIDGLWSSDSLDHESARPGYEFPDSPSPMNGCDAAGGAAGFAPLTEPGGESLYFLVVSVLGGDGEQEYGRNSSGTDRRDPAADPRDGSFACP